MKLRYRCKTSTGVVRCVKRSGHKGEHMGVSTTVTRWGDNNTFSRGSPANLVELAMLQRWCCHGELWCCHGERVRCSKSDCVDGSCDECANVERE